MVRALTTLVALLLLAVVPVFADVPPSQGVKFEQKLREQLPLNLRFHDESGRTVTLGDYFHGKPVILVLAYYRCPQLCSQILNGVVKAMLDMDLQLGKDYEIVTVSFDAREKPDLAAAKKRTYVDRYARPGTAEAWHFLTGDEASIRQLTDAVGFHFRYDEKFDQFAHPSGIMIVTPQGRLSRYLFNVDFKARDVQLALVEAAENKIGSPSDYVLLLCFLHYDETQGKYTASVLKIVRLGGVITVLAIVTMVSIFLWKEKRHARLVAEQASAEAHEAATGPA